MTADELLLATQAPAWPDEKSLDNAEEVLKLLYCLRPWRNSLKDEEWVEKARLLTLGLGARERLNLLGWWVYVLLFKDPRGKEEPISWIEVNYGLKRYGLKRGSLEVLRSSLWGAHFHIEGSYVRSVSRELYVRAQPLTDASSSGVPFLSWRTLMRICDYRHQEITVAPAEVRS